MEGTKPKLWEGKWVGGGKGMSSKGVVARRFQVEKARDGLRGSGKLKKQKGGMKREQGTRMDGGGVGGKGKEGGIRP